MIRPALAALVVAAIAAAPAAGDVYSRKHSVDARIATLHSRIAEAHQRAQELSAEIDSVSSRIHSLEGRVGDVSARLATLESDLALHQRKLERLTALFRLETKRYLFFRKTLMDRLKDLEPKLRDSMKQIDLHLSAP